jgi:ketosteroid isomerase-like protein
MADENLTAKEKRNVERVKSWMECWQRGDTASMVDHYADSCEVFGVLQNIYWARRGQSREDWRTIEIDGEKRFAEVVESRKFELVALVARGDTVAIETIATIVPKGGEPTRARSASFLTLDEDGKIICDHSYNSQFRPTLDNPEFSSAGPAEKAAIERVLEDNPVDDSVTTTDSHLKHMAALEGSA